MTAANPLTAKECDGQRPPLQALAEEGNCHQDARPHLKRGFPKNADRNEFGASKAEIDDVVRVVEHLGLRADTMPGATRVAIGVTGNQVAVDLSHFEKSPGVAEAIRVTKPYKLISLDLRPDRTVVDIEGAKSATARSPSSPGRARSKAASRHFAVADQWRGAARNSFRGGAFKPRTSPYSFSGLGKEALTDPGRHPRKFGLKIVSEALDEATVDMVEETADMIRVGARNMQNFTLLKRVGRSKLPVLMKRGMAATLEEVAARQPST